MLPFGLQLKTFENLRHFPMNLEIFDIEKEKERDNKIFGIIKIKQDSKKNKKIEKNREKNKEKKNSTVKNR
jgi:hypothetical protein